MAFLGIRYRAKTKIKEERVQSKQAHALKRLARAFYPYKVQVILVLISILLTTLLGLVNPLIVRYIFDEAIAKHRLGLLLLLVSIMVAIPILAGVVGVGQMYLSNLIGQRIMRDFRNNLYNHLQRMSLQFFTS